MTDFEFSAIPPAAIKTLNGSLCVVFIGHFNKRIHTILTNRVYVGTFEWAGKAYRGNHPTFIGSDLFEEVQSVMRGHNKPKYGKHDIAFRGILTCAHDNCRVTAEFKKGRYVYYRCSGYRGKCALPRFREEQISVKLGQALKAIHIPDPVLAQLQRALECEHRETRGTLAAQRLGLEQRLAALHRRMDQAYSEKVDGKIPEDFWERQMSTWRDEEHRLEEGISGLKQPSADRLLSIQRILELANRAYFLYFMRKPAQQAELLRMVLLNCAINGASVYPTYRKPFDMIFERGMSVPRHR